MILLFILLTPYIQAQNTPQKRASAQQRSDVRSGNKAYNHKAYTDAEAAYLKATDTLTPYYKAEYNLGNALYRQKAYDRAAQAYGRALQDARISDPQRAQALHNQGNAFLQQGIAQRNQEGGGMQPLQQAVHSYQEALKLNPKNQDTKYNLSYAKKLLAQAQQQGGGGGGQQNQDQNNDQNQQGQQQQQQQQGQQDQNQQGQQGQGQQPQQQQPQQPQNKNQTQAKGQQMQDAERLLNAVRNNEKQTLREQQKQQQAQVDGQIEKDW